MGLIKAFLNRHRLIQRKKAFIRAIIPYLWDIANHRGRNTQLIYAELLDKNDYLKNSGRVEDWRGTEAALEIIQRYRQWEGMSWKHKR